MLGREAGKGLRAQQGTAKNGYQPTDRQTDQVNYRKKPNRDGWLRIETWTVRGTAVTMDTPLYPLLWVGKVEDRVRGSEREEEKRRAGYRRVSRENRVPTCRHAPNISFSSTPPRYQTTNIRIRTSPKQKEKNTSIKQPRNQLYFLLIELKTEA